LKSFYLDYAAATPLDSEVAVAMQPYLSQQFYNPSATYLAGRAVRKDLEQARSSIAQNLGAKPVEIIFTAGATEANNLAIAGIMRQFPDGEVLVSAVEHESVLAPAKEFKHRLIPVDKQGIVNLPKLENMIGEQTVLVSVMLVNNELGSIQPIRETSQILNKLSILRKSRGNKLPLYLHTDAAQAANYLDLHVSRLGVDLLSINGGKIYGPKQTGVLFVRAGMRLLPLVLGGGQERNLRSGTENVAGFVGLAKALDKAQSRRKQESKRLAGLRDFLVAGLEKRIPSIVINGSDKHQSPHILHLSLPGQDNERLMMQLDELGVQVAVGSACSASKDEPSHVLKAIGLSDTLARSSLRFSFGHGTTKSDLKKAAELTGQLVTGNR
jgi:cysteine desulfurase